MSISADQAVDVLTPSLQENKLIVLAGSGISVPSDLPTWDQLLQGFIGFCEELQPYLPDEEKFEGLINDAKIQFDKYPSRVASVLKNRLAEIQDSGIPNVHRYFQKWLTATLTGTPNEYHRLLVNTSYPFILTTNYDNLLEAAADEEGRKELVLNSFSFEQTSKVASVIYERQPSIIHVHGDLSELALNRLIFTAEDYQIIEKSYPGFRLALQSLFIHYSVLFVGYGASDPHLEQVMEEISFYLRYDRQQSLPRCYLILHKDKVGAVHELYKGGLRTDIIEVDDYSETNYILKKLQQKSPR